MISELSGTISCLSIGNSRNGQLRDSIRLEAAPSLRSGGAPRVPGFACDFNSCRRESWPALPAITGLERPYGAACRSWDYLRLRSSRRYQAAGPAVGPAANATWDHDRGAGRRCAWAAAARRPGNLDRGQAPWLLLSRVWALLRSRLLASRDRPPTDVRSGQEMIVHRGHV